MVHADPGLSPTQSLESRLTISRMPIQLTWNPNSLPKSYNRVPIALELGGDDTTLAATNKGRIRFVEAPAAPGPNAGPSEPSAERLIATFHGTIHYDRSKPRAARITFEVFLKPNTTHAPNSQEVEGFDPECILGVDAFVLTFVNREFVIWLPFHVDTREGKFLEIQAIAEIDAQGGVREIGRSMVLNLLIRRTHAVDSTSNLPSGGPLSYNAPLVGNIIAFHEDYLATGGVRNPRSSTPTEIVLDPAKIPLPPTGTQVRFQPYVSGAMHIVLLTDLLDDISPPDSFLLSNIGLAKDAAAIRRGSLSTVKQFLPGELQAIFTDSGFAGVEVRWSDDPAAAALVQAFTGAFIRQTVGGNLWRLRNPRTPFVTSFWNFFVGSNSGNNTAGSGEGLTGSVPVTVGTSRVFLQNNVPIGSGTKSLTKPIEIVGSVFQDLLMTRSGLPRQYASLFDYASAVNQVAAKLTILIAHEVGHSLGLMHHCVIENQGNYSEQFGSPVLSIMSAGVESGGFGLGLRFHSQAKLMWQAAFGVNPTFSDAILQNKSWTPAEVFTMSWPDRKNRFIKSHGEESVSFPGLGAFPKTPPFATTPPNPPQKGTFF